MKRIAALRRAYVAIPLDDVAQKVCGSKTSPEDVRRMESLILRMVNIYPFICITQL
jgi:hypothetical protein